MAGESLLWWSVAGLAILAFIPAKIAGDKGHSFVGYWFFGLCFLLPAIVVALIINPYNPPDETARMGCPRCGESIAISASICRFCGVELAAGGESGPGFAGSSEDEYDFDNDDTVGTPALYRWLETRDDVRRSYDELEGLIARLAVDPSSPGLGPLLIESGWATLKAGRDVDAAERWLEGALRDEIGAFGSLALEDVVEAEMDYVCTTCDRTFEDRDQFANHLTTGHGYKPKEAERAIRVAEGFAD